MSIDPSPELKSPLEDALNEFENRAGTSLIQHQIIDRLKDCKSPESVIDVLRVRNFWRRRNAHDMDMAQTDCGCLAYPFN